MGTHECSTWAEGRDLLLTRFIDAPPDKVFAAWTQPSLIKQWFAPQPWTTPHVEMDVRAGGSTLIVMMGPDGTEFPNRGVYLEVIENQRLVFTDAFTTAWEPSEKPFMTVALTFATEGTGTAYTVRIRHWTLADREAHEKMGFHQGWPICAQQLASVVEKQ